MVFGAADLASPFDGRPDTPRINIGEQVNVTTAGTSTDSVALPITITQASGATLPAGTVLNGLFATADAFKPANRSVRGFFGVQNDPPTFSLDQNTFVQLGTPQDVVLEFTQLKTALPAGTAPFTGFELITPSEIFPPTLFP